MGMGFELGRGLGENAQAITSGGLGLGRGSWGLGLKTGVRRASGPMWRPPIRFVGHVIAGV
ncbi:hypothetical protein Hanom_Chr12g01162871 [Helianthus anomalus]